MYEGSSKSPDGAQAIDQILKFTAMLKKTTPGLGVGIVSKMFLFKVVIG
jgi:hypothetical protein